MFTVNAQLLVLEFLYNDGDIDTLPIEVAGDLFLAGNQFMIPKLQEMSENVIKNNLDTDSACSLLENVGEISPRLKDICTDFILAHYEDIIQTKPYGVRVST